MIISGKIDVFVYKKREMEFERDRHAMKYYRVIVDINDEVDEIPCNEEVYTLVDTGKVNTLAFAYNTKADRNPFKFTKVLKGAPADKGSGK